MNKINAEKILLGCAVGAVAIMFLVWILPKLIGLAALVAMALLIFALIKVIMKK